MELSFDLKKKRSIFPFLTTVKEVKVIAFALYVPQHKGRGTYCFWCGSVGVGVGAGVAGCLGSI